MYWQELIAVLLGGALGASSRFLLSTLVQFLPISSEFPLGICIVNLLGCFAIGILAARLVAPDFWRAFIFIGFLGGFTTFSSFIMDTLKLLQAGNWQFAAYYVLISVVGGLLLAALGFYLFRL